MSAFSSREITAPLTIPLSIQAIGNKNPAFASGLGLPLSFGVIWALHYPMAREPGAGAWSRSDCCMSLGLCQF
jgi:hypothetical protein